MSSMCSCAQCGRRFDWDTGPKLSKGMWPIQRFCSHGCLNAFKASRGGGKSAAAGGAAAGAVSGGIAGAIVSSLKESPEQIAARTAAQAEERANDRSDLENIRSVSFDGEARDVVNSLSFLASLTPSFMECIRPEKTKLVSAAADKAEVGIRTLRSLGDNSNADYFEKKFKGIKVRKFAWVIMFGGPFAAMILIYLFSKLF